MYVDDEYRRGVDRMLLDSHLDLARLQAAGFASDPSAPVAYGDDSQPFQVALNGPRRWLVDGLLRAPGVQHRIDQTVGQMTGGALSPADVHVFERRALDTATPQDYDRLNGLAGPPFDVSPPQKQSIDGIMGRIGTDAQADRFRRAYEGAVRAGQIRVR
jgi:hypothetical protein